MVYTVVVAFPRDMVLSRRDGDVKWVDRDVFTGTLEACRTFGANQVPLLPTIGAAWIQEEDGKFVESISEGPNEVDENISAALGI